MKAKKILLFIFLVLLIQVMPVVVSGDIGIPCAKGTADMCGFNDIFVLINNIIKFFLQVILLPFIIIIVAYAGGLFLTSGGNQETRKKAKSIFLNLLKGVFLILAAWLIVYTVFRALGYDTTRGRAGLSDKTINWMPNNVTATVPPVSNTNTLAQNTTAQTIYKASVSVNSTDPSNTKVTVTTVPKTSYKMPVLVSCLSGDGNERKDGQGSIASGSTVTTVSLKLLPDTDYSCTVENPENTLVLSDPTDTEFHTPKTLLSTKDFTVTKSVFKQDELVVYYTNADVLGSSNGFFSCKNGSTVLLGGGVAIDRTSKDGAFVYPLPTNVLNGIKTDTSVSCTLTVYGKSATKTDSLPKITQDFSGTLLAHKQNVLTTVFKVLLPNKINKDSVTLTLNGSINVDPNINIRCFSVTTNHLFQSKVIFDPTIITKSGNTSSTPNTFNVPIQLPVVWSGYGLRPLSFYTCEVDGRTLQNVSGYPQMQPVPLLSIFPVVTPPIPILKSMLPESKLLYPVSLGTPQIIYKNYVVPATPGNPTFKQAIPDSVFIPVINGFAVDNSNMNLSCQSMRGPDQGKTFASKVVVSGVDNRWLSFFKGLYDKDNSPEGFSINITKSSTTGFMHSSSYNCLASFFIEGRPQARSFIVNTPIYIDPREVGPVELYADSITANTTHAFFNLVASPRIENSVEYSCSNISGNYSGQITWPAQALGVRMPVAIPILENGPGLRPKTTYNCGLEGSTYQKERVNYKFIIKTP